MWVIGGLLVDGSFYEEVIASTRELLAAAQDNKQLRPCSLLFSAFHRLYQDVNGAVQLIASNWIRFWLRGPRVYSTPPQHDNRKRVKAPMLTSCPSGIIVSHSSRTEREKDPFTTLNILSALVEETYLAAFISCWLCPFVLST